MNYYDRKGISLQQRTDEGLGATRESPGSWKILHETRDNLSLGLRTYVDLAYGPSKSLEFTTLGTHWFQASKSPFSVQCATTRKS